MILCFEEERRSLIGCICTKQCAVRFALLCADHLLRSSGQLLYITAPRGADTDLHHCAVSRALSGYEAGHALDVST